MNTNFDQNWVSPSTEAQKSVQIESVQEKAGFNPNQIMRQMKFLMSVLVMTLLIVVSGMWYVFDRYGNTLATNMVKTDSLYTEVGDVRSDNMNLYLTLKKTQAELDTLHATLENLNDKLAGMDGADIDTITLDLQSVNAYLHGQNLTSAEVEEVGEAPEPKE